MLINYLIIFLICSVIGWISEVIYVMLWDGKITNRGFLNGPVCPIYGFGGLSIYLILIPFLKTPIIVFLLGMVITSAIEYITHYLMERFYKIRLWDYSKNFLNINGRVCLLNSSLFGMLSLLMMYGLTPILENLFEINEKYKIIFVLISGVYMLIDFVVTLIVMEYVKLYLIDENIVSQLKKSRSESNKRFTKRAKELNKIINHANKKIKKSMLYYVVLKRMINAFPSIKNVKKIKK